MSYRSEDWEKERDQWLNRVGGEFADSGEVMEASVIYEAGADAMLKAIRERGFILGESLRNVGPGWANFDPKGKWHSIPNDN